MGISLTFTSVFSYLYGPKKGPMFASKNEIYCSVLSDLLQLYLLVFEGIMSIHRVINSQHNYHKNITENHDNGCISCIPCSKQAFVQL